MGKIAVDLEVALARRARDGSPGRATGRLLGRGNGWAVEDVICSSGPQDRPFEELHEDVSVAVVAAGTFQYRTPGGCELMTPGSLLLGNPGQYFECGHEHGDGDRCFAFRYRPDFFEQVAADAGMPPSDRRFRVPRLPPLRELSSLLAQIFTAGLGSVAVSWEELSLRVAAHAATMGGAANQVADVPLGALARVTRVVRQIERDPSARFDLGALAAQACLSKYHFLRSFEGVTGVTPHQFVMRARLREAAVLLVQDDARVIEVAFNCGFGDVSNFNHAFRSEFGVNPREYRRTRRTGSPRGFQVRDGSLAGH